MSTTVKLLFSATNALNKWLKADLPRLPVNPGKQSGVCALDSSTKCFCWQVHIIDNHYQSAEKTIIACEANSRFIFFLPVTNILSLQELTEKLMFEWQTVLVETIDAERVLPRFQQMKLLSDISEIVFEPEWVRNTDLSINGHISDAGLWVTDTLRERNLAKLSPELTSDIAVYLNTQTRSAKQRKEKFIPVERLLDYCRKNYVSSVSEAATFDSRNSNVIDLSEHMLKPR